MVHPIEAELLLREMKRLSIFLIFRHVGRSPKVCGGFLIAVAFLGVLLGVTEIHLLTGDSGGGGHTSFSYSESYSSKSSSNTDDNTDDNQWFNPKDVNGIISYSKPTKQKPPTNEQPHTGKPPPLGITTPHYKSHSNIYHWSEGRNTFPSNIFTLDLQSPTNKDVVFLPGKTTTLRYLVNPQSYKAGDPKLRMKAFFLKGRVKGYPEFPVILRSQLIYPHTSLWGGNLERGLDGAEPEVIIPATSFMRFYAKGGGGIPLDGSVGRDLDSEVYEINLFYEIPLNLPILIGGSTNSKEQVGGGGGRKNAVCVDGGKF